MNRRRSIACFVAALLVLSTIGAVPPVAEGQRFEETTRVVVVEIPVEVTRDGKPVRGLSADDFEVLEGRKKQKIVGFDVVDLTIGGDEAPEPARIPSSARRHFLLLFDLALSYPSSILRARDAARELVETSLHPSDLVAVGVYSSSRGAELRLGFTSDRNQIALAIETLGMPQLLQTSLDPLGIVYQDRVGFRNEGREGVPDQSGLVDRGFDAEAELLEILENIETVVGEAQERNKILALTGSLTELANMMAAVDGRKHVVFLSEGFDSSILLGTGVDSQEQQRQIQQANEAAMSGEVWEVRSDERFGSTSTLGQVEAMTQEFLRADCTIQSVDIGGMRAEGDVRPRRQSDDGLHMMADQTGGQYYRNFNDLGEAMGSMLERTSVTYVLAIQPEELTDGGKFRRLKVRLKKGAGNAQIAHRPGYYPPKPLARQSPVERRLATADLVLSGREGGPVSTSVLAAPFLGDGEQAYVPVLIEIDGDSLLAGHTGDKLPGEIYAYAIAADGSVADFFTQPVGFDLAKVEAGLRQSGFKFWGHFDLPPGSYTVRTVVRNSASGASGVRAASLTVPTPGGSEAALLPPFFPEPAGKWLLGREPNAGEGVEYPFTLGGQAFIPAARPLLKPGEVSQLALVGYNLGEGALGVLCRLLDAEGGEVEGARMILEAREPASVPGQQRLVARLETGEIAAGDYTLEVTIRDEDSGRTQTSALPVSVEG